MRRSRHSFGIPYKASFIVHQNLQPSGTWHVSMCHFIVECFNWMAMSRVGNSDTLCCQDSFIKLEPKDPVVFWHFLRSVYRPDSLSDGIIWPRPKFSVSSALKDFLHILDFHTPV